MLKNYKCINTCNYFYLFFNFYFLNWPLNTGVCHVDYTKMARIALVNRLVD